MKAYNVTVNGKTYSVQVEEAGVSSAPAVSAPAVSAPAPATAPAGVGTPLTAPLPGMVLDLKVASGTAVKKGDVVMILEAMKMENEVFAPCDGVVSFAVTKGQTVVSGETLATFA